MMIVKVQLSLATDHPEQQVLVYNKFRTIKYQGPADEHIKSLMKNAHKSFFYAQMQDTVIVIKSKAPHQDW